MDSGYYNGETHYTDRAKSPPSFDLPWRRNESSATGNKSKNAETPPIDKHNTRPSNEQKSETSTNIRKITGSANKKTKHKKSYRISSTKDGVTTYYERPADSY